MAIRVYCSNPHELLRNIRTKIEEGSIDTWELDNDGDFTHTPPQWVNLAWLRARVFDDHLTFNIIGSKRKNLSKTVYGIYHGRFIEMLLTHFDLQFDRACATALADKRDILPHVGKA